ncbi:MAG: hypothetical protein KTR14_11520 [Vampirovibrio sp.]|nr:hypothetical protein [Vampirovibrio sp.]
MIFSVSPRVNPSVQPVFNNNRLKANPRISFGQAEQTTPSAANKLAEGSKLWGKSLVGGFVQDVNHVLGNGKSESSNQTKDGEPLATYSKLAGACFEKPLPAGGEKTSHHTHHYAHVGPVVSARGNNQATVIMTGETVSPDLIREEGLDVEKGQAAVQVNKDLMAKYLQGLKTPLSLEDIPKKAFRRITSACFDTAEGNHMHHHLYTAPGVSAVVKGKTKDQQMFVVVGQTMDNADLRTKGNSLERMEPEVQQGVMVAEDLFRHGNNGHQH